MRAIMMSIKPKYVAKILNGEKTIEIRKRFPKDYRGWVYIYCTKDKSGNNNGNVIGRCYPMKTSLKVIGGRGKAVARFYCDKVEEIDEYYFLNKKDFVKTCLSIEELDNYLQGKNGYAIHISQLEIFDKPKELKEFVRCKWGKPIWLPLTKAPQSWMWCYVEE